MSWLRGEIFEQPAVLAAELVEQRAQAETIAAAIRTSGIRYAFLAARGTSDNAGRYANYIWGSRNGIPLALATPSLFTFYDAPPRLEKALVVGVSQSGRSPDIVSVVENGRLQGSLSVVITNAPDSPLAAAAEHVFDIGAGEERAVAATKSYTAELLAIAMISAALQDASGAWEELARVPEWVAAALAEEERIAGLAQRYRYLPQCVVLGRGYNYATAFEWALKMKELNYIVAEPYSSADFLHGPIAMVGGGFPVLAVAPQGKVFESMFATLVHLGEHHAAELIIISDDPRALALAQAPLHLPAGIPEWLTPIVSIVLAQLFTYHLTLVRGLDPDHPRGLSKVTRTN